MSDNHDLFEQIEHPDIARLAKTAAVKKMETGSAKIADPKVDIELTAEEMSLNSISDIPNHVWNVAGLNASLREDVDSLEFPFFAVDEKDTRKIYYPSEENPILQIIPPVSGRATMKDKDVLLFCISKLVAGFKAGANVSKVIEFSMYDLLSFTNRSDGAKSYKLLKEAFVRLGGTQYLLNTPRTKTMKASTTFVKLVDEIYFSDDGKIRITVSERTYDAAKKMEVLALPTQYFSVDSLVERRLYEIGRKHCGHQPEWKISLSSLHEKVGTKASLVRFRNSVKELCIKRNSVLLNYYITYDSKLDQLKFYPNPNFKDDVKTYIESIPVPNEVTAARLIHKKELAKKAERAKKKAERGLISQNAIYPG